MVRLKHLVAALVVLVLSLVGAAAWTAQSGSPRPSLSEERAVAGTVSEARLVETVRRLVSFGHRM